MKSKNVIMTIGSVVLGTGLIMGTSVTTAANHHGMQGAGKTASWCY